MALIRAKFTVKGKVQMVGFRHFTKVNAEQYNLKGYAKNLFDSSVEVLVEGGSESIELLKNALNKGPSRAWVESVEPEYSDYIGEYDSFYIY